MAHSAPCRRITSIIYQPRPRPGAVGKCLTLFHLFLNRVWRPAAEAEGPHPGRHPQHRRGEAAAPGRSRRRRRLGLEEAAPLLHASGPVLRHTHGGRAVQLHVRVPGVLSRVCVRRMTKRQRRHSVINSQFNPVTIFLQKDFLFSEVKLIGYIEIRGSLKNPDLLKMYSTLVHTFCYRPSMEGSTPIGS